MSRAAELIERKRNGEAHSAEELTELILGYARGDVPDYQMAAWCMAVYFRGLTGAETHALTDAMIASGDTIDLGAALGRRVVDKHSTGGVGDKTTIAVGPIVAACAVPFGKMSGRGLGHTGGTLDKLESIPGFRVEHELGEVWRPLAAQRRDRLTDLERVPDRGAERLVHVGEQADDVLARAAAEVEHALGEDLRVLERLHKGAVADLDVEHDRVRACGELLRHDARGDQRHDVDGRGHVPQAVEALVGGDEIGGLADDREPEISHLRYELVRRQLDAEPRDRLQLVERAARVPEPAAAHLPERDPAGGDDRADRDRGLVADAARRVLVDDAAASRAPRHTRSPTQ